MMNADEPTGPTLGTVRATYHVAPDVPREEMWRVISAGIREMRAGTHEAQLDEAQVDEAQVVDLSSARRGRGPARHPFAWIVAAAALFVLGLGIGRYGASGRGGEAVGPVAAGPATVAPAPGGALRQATREHLGRTESLLSMVRADARSGTLDPATEVWARGLLAETRLLLDAGAEDSSFGTLLSDLELVLIQIVAVAGSGSPDEALMRTELALALRGMEEGEVLPRIQAVLPGGMAGT